MALTAASGTLGEAAAFGSGHWPPARAHGKNDGGGFVLSQ